MKSKIAIPYEVKIAADKDDAARLRFTFIPKGRAGDEEALSSEGRRHIAVVSAGEGRTVVKWKSPGPSGKLRAALEAEVGRRLSVRAKWTKKVGDLVIAVKAWSDELGWVTKVVDKRLDDREIGPHRVPALLLQDQSVRLYLEPVSRSAPGAKGVVDLCVMPTYDDVASFYYYGKGWHLHYGVDDLADGSDKPLAKDSLQVVLEEMKRHAD